MTPLSVVFWFNHRQHGGRTVIYISSRKKKYYLKGSISSGELQGANVRICSSDIRPIRRISGVYQDLHMSESSLCEVFKWYSYLLNITNGVCQTFGRILKRVVSIYDQLKGHQEEGSMSELQNIVFGCECMKRQSICCAFSMHKRASCVSSMHALPNRVRV